MNFQELSELIFAEIVPKIENHQGLSIFAREKAKFEGWLKVELCDSLSKHFRCIIPEKNFSKRRRKIDVTLDDWAIEIKTVNTNYKHKNVKDKKRPISKNIQGVIDDITKLKSTNYTNKAVLFIVFPANDDNRKWHTHHHKKICNLLRKMESKQFTFENGVQGYIYFGSI